jgi:hypothetical protein
VIQTGVISIVTPRNIMSTEQVWSRIRLWTRISLGVLVQTSQKRRHSEGIQTREPNGNSMQAKSILNGRALCQISTIVDKFYQYLFVPSLLTNIGSINFCENGYAITSNTLRRCNLIFETLHFMLYHSHRPNQFSRL